MEIVHPIFLVVLNLFDGFSRHLLSLNLLEYILLSRSSITNADQYTGRDIDGDRARKNGCRQCLRSSVVVDGPGACPESNLQQGMAVKQYDNSHEKAQGKSMMGCCLMRLIERV